MEVIDNSDESSAAARRLEYEAAGKDLGSLHNHIITSIRILKDNVDIIPTDIIAQAAGIVVITQVRVGFGFSGQGGYGLLVKRLGPLSWSPPVSIVVAGTGFGLYFGGERTDIVLVLNNETDVSAFTSSAQFKIGLQGGIAAGPKGRNTEIDFVFGKRGYAGTYFYSRSKGASIGASLESALVCANHHSNKTFYGEAVKMQDVLEGLILIPEKHEKVVDALAATLNALATGDLANYRDENVLPIDDSLRGAESEYTLSNASTAYKPKPPTQQNGNASASASASAYASQSRQSTPNNGLGITGKALLTRAASTPHDKELLCVLNHVLDENDPTNYAHNIISVPYGAKVLLFEGTLENGLGTPYYKDYVVVNYNGKIGKVSKWALRKI